MKNFFFLLIFFVHLTVIKGIKAQDRAGIYKIYFNIDRKLTHPTQVTVNGNIVQNGNLNSTRLSDIDIDSIKKMIERTVSFELRAQTECIYRKSRNGKDIKTNDFGSMVRGLPVSSKRKAIKLHEKEYYVDVSIIYNALQRTSIGAALIGMRQYKPVVTIRIIAYNDQRKPVYRKRIFVNDFEKLQGFQSNINGVEIQNFQVLTTQQIREMLAKSLQELVERGKQ
jgi:hypothetical protein